MNLTPDNIICILNECKGHVKSLKISGRSIEVEFLTPHQQREQPPSTHNQGQFSEEAIPIPDDKNLMKDLKEGKDEERVEEENLIDELTITDPSKMEDLIAMGEVVSEEKDN